MSDWSWPTVRSSKQAEIPSLPKKMAVSDSSPVPKQNHLEPENTPDVGERWSAAVVEARKEGERREEEGEVKTERLSNGISEQAAGGSSVEGEEVMDTAVPSNKPVENGDRFVDARTDVDMEKEEEEEEEGEAKRDSQGSSEDELRQSIGSVTSGEFLPSNINMYEAIGDEEAMRKEGAQGGGDGKMAVSKSPELQVTCAFMCVFFS